MLKVFLSNYDTTVSVQDGDVRGLRFDLPPSLCRNGVGVPGVGALVDQIHRALVELQKPQ